MFSVVIFVFVETSKLLWCFTLWDNWNLLIREWPKNILVYIENLHRVLIVFKRIYWLVWKSWRLIIQVFLLNKTAFLALPQSFMLNYNYRSRFLRIRKNTRVWLLFLVSQLTLLPFQICFKISVWCQPRVIAFIFERPLGTLSLPNSFIYRCVFAFLLINLKLIFGRLYIFHISWINFLNLFVSSNFRIILYFWRSWRIAYIEKFNILLLVNLLAVFYLFSKWFLINFLLHFVFCCKVALKKWNLLVYFLVKDDFWNHRNCWDWGCVLLCFFYVIVWFGSHILLCLWKTNTFFWCLLLYWLRYKVLMAHAYSDLLDSHSTSILNDWNGIIWVCRKDLIPRWTWLIFSKWWQWR